VGRFFETQCR